jgi:hypothetical protein
MDFIRRLSAAGLAINSPSSVEKENTQPRSIASDQELTDKKDRIERLQNELDMALKGDTFIFSSFLSILTTCVHNTINLLHRKRSNEIGA